MASRTEITGALEALVRLIDHSETLAAIRDGAVLHNARSVLESARKGDIAPLPWTPFVEVSPMRPSEAQLVALARDSGADLAAVKAAFARVVAEETLWVNSRYQVNIRATDDRSVHLSIKRVDQRAVHDWRDLQRIKNELIGPECEAVELYPAHSRLVDTATQYHLWCSTDPAYRFPIGFTEGLVSNRSGAHAQRISDP